MWRGCTGVVVLVVGLAAPAHAEWNPAVRFGASAKPTAVWLGAHIQSKTWAGLSFRPGINFGIGEAIALGADLEVLWQVPLMVKGWRPYFGGGSFAVLASGAGRSADEAAYSGGGPTIVVGVRNAKGLFVDAHLGVAGVDNVPIRVTVGFALTR